MKKKEYIIKGFNFHTHDLEYYLEKHPMCKLNTRIYKKYTENGGLDFDIEEIYNEAYYTATRIFHDKYPLNNFYKRYDYYRNADKLWDDSFCRKWWMVYFIIHHANANKYRANLMDFIGCFRTQKLYTEPLFNIEKDWISEIDIFQGFDTIEDWCPTQEECLNIDFEPFDFALDTPVSPNGIKDSEWQAMTDNFNEDYIRFIVESYKDQNDAATAVVKIHDANFNIWDELPCDFYDSRNEFYDNLKAEYIKNDEDVRHGRSESAHTTNIAVVNQQDERVKHLENEIANLRKKNEELKTSLESMPEKEGDEAVNVSISARKCVALCKEFKVNSKANTQKEINALLACLTSKSLSSFNNYWSDKSEVQKKTETWAKNMKDKMLPKEK